MLSSVGRKIEWLSDLTHVGGAVKVSWAEMEASQDSLVAPTCGNERAAKCAFSWGKLGNSGKKARPGASPASPIPQRCGGPLARVVVTAKGAYSPYPIRWIRCRHCRALKAEHCQPPPAPYLFSWFQVSKPSSIAIFRGHRSSGPATDHLPSEMLASRAWRSSWFPSGRLDISPRAWRSRRIAVVVVHLGVRG